MTTLAANTSATITLDGDDVLTTDGNATFQITPTSGGKGEGYLTGHQTLGPYGQYVTIVLTSINNPITYSQASDSSAGDLVRLSGDGTSLVSGDENIPISAFVGINRPSIAVIGDSRGANHVSNTFVFSGRGPLVWAALAQNGRLRFSTADVYAVASSRIKDNNGAILSAYNQIPTLTKTYNFIAAITAINDALASRTDAQMIADMTDLIAAMQATGAVPILFTEVVSVSMSAAIRAVIDRYNSWLRAYVIGKRLVLIDAYAICVNWSSATNQPLGSGGTRYLYDDLHFAPVAAEKMGYALSAQLDRLVPMSAWLPMMSAEDTYNATTRPYGNLLTTQGAFLATGGANRDAANDITTASTGTVGAGCRLYKGAGQAISVAGSVTTEAATIQGQAITLPVQDIAITSGGTGNQTCSFQLPTVSTGIAAGDVIQFAGWINIKTATGLLSFSPYIQERSAASATIQTTSPITGFSASSVYYPPAETAKNFYFESPPMTLTSEVSTLKVMFDIIVDGATANVDIQAAMFTVRKVDPLALV